jgi:histone deacetylase complex regulatory component SIN3
MPSTVGCQSWPSLIPFMSDRTDILLNFNQSNSKLNSKSCTSNCKIFIRANTNTNYINSNQITSRKVDRTFSWTFKICKLNCGNFKPANDSRGNKLECTAPSVTFSQDFHGTFCRRITSCNERKI